MMITFTNQICTRLAIGVLTIAALASCGVAKEEVARSPSPDGMVDAVLIKGNVGATAATPSEIYIVPSGSEPEGEPSIRGDYFENIKLVWKEPRFLEITYSKGRIFAFTNFWQSKHVQNFEYVVELRLKPERDTFSLK